MSAPRPPRPGRRCVCPDRRRRGRCRRRSGRSRHEGARACATWVSAGGRHARVTSRLSRRAHSRLFSSLPFIAPRHRLLPSHPASVAAATAALRDTIPPLGWPRAARDARSRRCAGRRGCRDANAATLHILLLLRLMDTRPKSDLSPCQVLPQWTSTLCFSLPHTTV